MNYLFALLSRRFIFKSSKDGGKLRFTPMVILSTLGIALGMSIILLSAFIVRGFKQEMRDKLNGTTGNLQLLSALNSYSQFSYPFTVSDSSFVNISNLSKELGGFTTGFSTETGVIKADSSFVGIVFQGVDENFQASSFYNYDNPQSLVESFSSDEYPILSLSTNNIQKLNKSVGDTVQAFFYTTNGFKIRKFKLEDTFDTGFLDFDNNVGLTQINVVRGIQGWNNNQYGGIKIIAPKINDNNWLEDQFYPIVLDEIVAKGERISMLKAENINPVMFGWISLLDTNIAVIFGLLIFVAAMTMIAGLIVTILDKTQAISTLKAIGMPNKEIKKVFHRMGVRIILKGMFVGNILAIIISLLQAQFKIFKLDPSQYYMKYIPIDITLWNLIIPNLLAFILLSIIIYLPTTIISNISPAKGIRFE